MRNSFYPVLNSSGQVARLAILGLDITDKKRAEEQLQKLNLELEQRINERTAALQESIKELEAFTYTVSHDLRAPLRAMDGFSRLLLEEYTQHLDESACHYLATIRQNSQHMARLIDDLLAFSRISRQAINHMHVNMNSLVEQVLDELFSGQDRDRYTIQVQPLESGMADPVLLKQVFINLLSNAIKFSSKREHPVITVSSSRNDREVIYAVKDNGAGFDIKYAHKLFGVFQRLHRPDEYEGTGVGLAIVQRVVYRHGGRVWVEAALDQGATFYFSLPR